MPLDSNPSAFEREQYFENMLKDPNFEHHDVDYVSLLIGDSGNEQALGQIMDMADTSSGELGKMRTLERDVDQNVMRLQGSLSKNLSDMHQNRHQAMENMPNVTGPEDVEPAIAAVYEQLEQAGIPEADLIGALAAGGPEDNVATLAALNDMAGEELGEYIQVAHAEAWAADPSTDGLPPSLNEEPNPEALTPDYETSAPAPMAMKMG